jgi:hypothetical protein
MQRAEFVLIRTQKRFLGLTRLGKHNFGLVIDKRVQFGIQALNAIKVSAGHLHRRNFFAADLCGEFAGRKKLRARWHAEIFSDEIQDISEGFPP